MLRQSKQEFKYPAFYHGTSTALNIKEYIFPPIYTQIKREEWRAKHIDKVFTTTSLLSAQNYAKKACNKYGGKPVIYRVKPMGNLWNRINGEFLSDKARIIEEIA